MSGSVLVTGGAGFIGSHACKALKGDGFTPVTFDNLSTGRLENVKYGPFVRGDLRDGAAVARALKDHDCRAVIHFAASAYVGESMVDPAAYYENNIEGMNGLLRGCAQAGVGAVVFSSSCATYGIPESLPIRETTAQRPINPYGRTKLIGEWILQDHAAAHGLRFAALRYFNAAGADPEGELGEHHDPETHLIPLALRAAAGQGGPLRVFGTDYPTRDGTCVRDYIHVHDLARAHVLALRHLLAGGESLKLNLGRGKGLSIREILKTIADVTGRDVPVIWDARRAGDPPELVADPAEAWAKLGFRAEYSEPARLIKDAAPWFGLTLVEG